MTESNTNETQIEYVDPRVLIPAEYNPRKADPKDYEQLKASIEKFGIDGSPIIVNSADNRKNVIIGGHFRVRVAIDLGIEKVPVIYRSIPDIKQEQEYNLRLNKNLGKWDFDLLADIDKQLLIDVGFESNDIDKIFDLVEDEFDADQAYADIVEPVTKRGDVYVLGRHRLLCGDCTQRADFELLFGDRKARLVFTDPPYNVNYKSPAGLTYSSKRFGGNGGKIFNDNKSDAECFEFYVAALRNLMDFTSDDASIYWWYASKNEIVNRLAFIEANWHISQVIIWLKNGIVFSQGQDYHRCYEPAMFGWKTGQKHYKNKEIATYKEVFSLEFQDFEDVVDCWYKRRDDPGSYVHPTQKPVALADRALRKNSQRGDVVVDVFGGSGSTMMACEQMDRSCFTMELDPKFCDVIVKRWEAFTNQKAELIRHGESKPEHGGVEAAEVGGAGA